MDMMAAIAIALLMMGATLALLSQQQTYPNEHLFRYATDYLTVAGKDGSFDKGFDGNWSSLEDLVDTASGNVCFNLSIKDEDEVLVYNHSRSCGAADYVVVAKRLLTDDNQFYLAELRTWYR